MLLNDEWVNNEIKKEIKRYLETRKNMRTNNLQSMGHRENSPEKEIHNITGLSHETNKRSQINNVNLHLKDTWEKVQRGRRQDIVKIREEMTEIESKKPTIDK